MCSRGSMCTTIHSLSFLFFPRNLKMMSLIGLTEVGMGMIIMITTNVTMTRMQRLVPRALTASGTEPTSTTMTIDHHSTLRAPVPQVTPLLPRAMWLLLGLTSADLFYPLSATRKEEIKQTLSMPFDSSCKNLTMHSIKK